FTAQPGSLRRPNGQAFTSHLSGQDMATLLRTGYVPVAFVMGNCVFHIAVQGLMQTLRQAGRNVEMPQWTQGSYESRELAMSRMQSEAERDGGTGIVGVHFAISNYAWGHHTVEFYAAGTAVRRGGKADTITPSFVLPMSG
ncbi:MAG: heavy metal-binding domain-containing protein, partial [Mycobacteriaceae bacterium]|nr:heavy metal-binding domain-containing protein [Mycobacteriaceae bacterium]